MHATAQRAMSGLSVAEGRLASRRLQVPRTHGRASETETSLHGHQSLQAPLVRVGAAQLLRVNSGRHLEREVLADLLHVK